MKKYKLIQFTIIDNGSFRQEKISEYNTLLDAQQELLENLHLDFQYFDHDKIEISDNFNPNYLIDCMENISKLSSNVRFVSLTNRELNEFIIYNIIEYDAF